MSSIHHLFLVFLPLSSSLVNGLQQPCYVTMPQHPPPAIITSIVISSPVVSLDSFPTSTSSSSPILRDSISTFLLSSISSSSSESTESTSILQLKPNLLKQFKSDTVVRVLDANTIKLEKTGVVSLAGVQTPTNGGFPDCTTTSPTKLINKLLAKKTPVKVKVLKDSSESTTTTTSRALIVRDEDTILVNTELIKYGFAKPVARGRAAAEEILPGFTDSLNQLNQQARNDHIGLYQLCSTNNNDDDNAVKSASSFPINLDEQFEPLELTTQTKWGVDGGKTILVEREKRGIMKTPPPNPGDTKGCSDFETYEDALAWFEKYNPYYGDVANLDRDGDGVPCPKLPHTGNMEKYRKKIPTIQQGNGGW